MDFQEEIGSDLGLGSLEYPLHGEKKKFIQLIIFGKNLKATVLNTNETFIEATKTA